MAFAWLSRLTFRAVLVLCVVIFTISCTASNLAWSIVLRLRLMDLRANMVGDPERVYMDDCMKDFDDESVESNRYRERHRECVTKVDSSKKFKLLPRIRPTVDEGICDQAYLCSGSNDCEDRGEPGKSYYEPGVMTKCFDLITRMRIEADPVEQKRLSDEAQQKCMRGGRWDGYKKKAWIKKCMWKHFHFGVCTNNLRTNCPGDSSCCPTAQSHLDLVDQAKAPRQDHFICRKSPIVGLYCHHIDYRVPRNGTSSAFGDLCTAATCENFNWCRDFADVPGLCLRRPCQDYKHAFALCTVCIVAAVFGVFFDLVDIIVMCTCPSLQKIKSCTNGIAACIKGTGCLICVVSGAREFAVEAASNACIVGNNGALAAAAETAATSMFVTSLLATAGSLCLAPLSSRWGGRLSDVPYARVR
eukprot:TRINITY_DN40815_c0_g1_i1.p1 TRINITY_DN40815_c0_g1~~TRINITY_DN40815_c0_g1_i1.p1  ORF type:complete len:416 (+),score=50.83 TRINITY_DN40815_c0_g1_i1:186-1433(+)